MHTVIWHRVRVINNLLILKQKWYLAWLQNVRSVQRGGLSVRAATISDAELWRRSAMRILQQQVRIAVACDVKRQLVVLAELDGNYLLRAFDAIAMPSSRY